MTETKTYCDHCGKVLNDMHDYCDITIEVDEFIKADLCKACYVELGNIARAFVKKGGAE